MKKYWSMINVIGFIFLIFGITAIIDTFFVYGSVHILWFCYIGLILLGIGFLKRNHLLIESQLNILTIPLIIWAFDFTYFLIFGNSLLNIVDYFFEQGPILAKIITLQHLFTIPLAIYGMRFIKPKQKNSWMLSFIQVVIIFIITRVLTSYEDNVNWVYHTSLNLGIPYYSLFWFSIIFIIILATNFFLKKLQKK